MPNQAKIAVAIGAVLLIVVGLLIAQFAKEE